MKYVDPSGELFDWFENQYTGAVFFNSHYGKNDAGKGNMLGDGWKWIGGNDKFGTVNNNYLNVFHEYYSSGGGYAFVWPNRSENGFLPDGYEISFGSKSEAFMSKMGYKKKPLVADVHVIDKTQSVGDAHAPIWYNPVDEVTEKVHTWTYAEKGAQGNYSIIGNYRTTTREPVAAGIIAENKFERRRYDYSKPQGTNANQYINFILSGGADLMKIYFSSH